MLSRLQNDAVRWPVPFRLDSDLSIMMPVLIAHWEGGRLVAIAESTPYDWAIYPLSQREIANGYRIFLNLFNCFTLSSCFLRQTWTTRKRKNLFTHIFWWNTPQNIYASFIPRFLIITSIQIPFFMEKCIRQIQNKCYFYLQPA